MSNSDKYRAIIRPRPELAGEEILWGWDVTLTDKTDDNTYPFSGGGEYKSADEALSAGGRTMVRWMNALAIVKDKEVSEINLDAHLPEPVETPAEPEPDAAPEEKLEAEVDKPPSEPVKTETGETA